MTNKFKVAVMPYTAQCQSEPSSSMTYRTRRVADTANRCTWKQASTPRPLIRGRVPSMAPARSSTLEAHLAELADLRDEARALGKYDAAISAEHKRGLALGYYIERRESGAAGAFQAKTREEADRVQEETIARSQQSRPSSARRRSQRAESAPRHLDHRF